MDQREDFLPEQADEDIHSVEVPEVTEAGEEVPEVEEFPADTTAGEVTETEEYSGETVSGEVPATEEYSGETTALEVTGTEEYSGETISGKVTETEEYSGETVSGEVPETEEYSGETVAGEVPETEEYSGETVSGEVPETEEYSVETVSGEVPRTEEFPSEPVTEEVPEREIMSDLEAVDSVSEDSAEIFADMVYGESQPNVPPMFNPFISTGYISQDEKMRQQQLEAERRRKRENRILAVFAAMLVTMLGVSTFGIASDLRRSSRELTGMDGVAPVVLYKNTKPEGANELANFQDENGRYTTEGAAAAVRESIVEIYTYSDSMRKDLVGTGSGVVITEDGYIVTNAHVLQADGYHSVHTTDNRVFSAKVIGRDAKTDIAVIKVNGVKLTPAVLGDSDEVLVGEQVIAVGNPAGLSSTVTDGIVSAVNRKIRGDSTGFEMNCIQTNADISPGNSGGALVNMYGQVIGITSSKYVSSSYEGLGFAITINDAGPIIEELIKKGYISGRFRIGITMIDMSSDSKKDLIEEDLGFDLPENFEGIYITEIDEDFDIANTELKPGDFITKIDDDAVHTYDDLQSVIRSRYAPGDTVTATCAHVDEDGKITTYKIKFVIKEDTSGDF